MDKPKAKRGPGKPFQKGCIGNPGGRPKAIKEALEAFRRPADLEALRQNLFELATTSADSKVQIAATKEYHDRAYGKAPQAITGEDGKPLSFGVIVLPAEDK